MNKSLVKQLIKFGYTEKEAAVYIATLELGSGTPLEISKKSGVKRPTTYIILEALVDKGFIIRSLKEKTQIFTAQPPQKILNSLTEKLTAFKNLLPRLAAIHNLEKAKPKIIIFEGEDAPDQAYEDIILKHKGELLFISSISEVYKRYPRTIKMFERKPKNKNFSAREILFDEPIAKTYAKKNQKQFHQIRFLSSANKPTGSDIGIFGNKILISSLQDEIFIISIEDKKIAQITKLLFEQIWKNLKK